MERSGSGTTSRGKKVLFAILVVVLVLLVLEGIAWLVDLKVGFHERATRALALIEPQVGPIVAQEELPTPEEFLFVRSAFGEEPLTEPYMLAGKPVPGANSVPALVPYHAAQAREEPRRKIFIVGGSVAFGFPFDYADSFPALLQERLGESGYLVLCASRVGFSSGELVPLVGQIARGFSPSVVVLFLGNNEWTRWTPRDESVVSPNLLRFYRMLSFSRLATLSLYGQLRSWEKGQGEGRAGGEAAFGSHRQLTGHEIALRNPAREFDGKEWEETRAAFLDNFARNVRLMARQARSGGARVVVCTMPFLHKLSPAWKHRQPLCYDELNREQVAATIERAVADLKRGDSAAAIAALDSALALEPKAPLLRYLKARALELSGDFSAAEVWYAESRDAMVGNLGAVLSINERLRRIAREEGATLVDLAAGFDRRQHALGGWFNQDLIADDCHPSREGQRLIAEALARVIE